MSSTRSVRAQRRAAKQRNQRIVVIVIIALILAALAYVAYTGLARRNQAAQVQNMVTTASGLKYLDEVVGTGQEAKPGDSVTVHYSGYLDNGTKFDSSVDRGQPYTFALGQGAVIPGWDEGVAGMKVGGKRKLVIPPDLAYGAGGAGGGVIPPNATLTFDVELLAVNSAQPGVAPTP